MSLNIAKAIRLAPPPFHKPLQHTINVFHISNPVEFLATVFYESNYLQTLSENLNYTCDALLKRFGRHRITYEDAMKYGRSPTRPANQQAIANAIYGGKWGHEHLGNTQPTDGWLYRGQGGIQLTGRENWTRFSQYMGDPELLANPSHVLKEPMLACLTAGFFWAKLKNLNECGSDMRAITRKVTGASDTAIKTRMAYQTRIMGIAMENSL